MDSVVEQSPTTAEIRVPEFRVAFRPAVRGCQKHQNRFANRPRINEFLRRVVIFVPQPVFVVLVEFAGALYRRNQTLRLQPRPRNRLFAHDVQARFQCLNRKRDVQKGLRTDIHNVRLDDFDHFADVVANLNAFQIALQLLGQGEVAHSVCQQYFGLHQRLIAFVGQILRFFVRVTKRDQLHLRDFHISGQVCAAKNAACPHARHAHSVVGLRRGRSALRSRDNLEVGNDQAGQRRRIVRRDFRAEVRDGKRYVFGRSR